ncbi:MAG TPA: cytochrome c3 family protein [Bellilinea sp.]|nr:cytochrome c3 family protein [Bellilinea sp.]
MKKICLLLTLVLLVLLLAACGPKATQAPTAMPTSDSHTIAPTVAPQPTTPPPTIAPTAAPIPTEKKESYTYKEIVIPHTLEGRLECDTCHGPAGSKPYPEDHKGRTNISCQHCHVTEDKLASIVPVSGFKKTECLDCHGPFEDLVARKVEATAEDGNTVNPHMFVPHSSTLETDIMECTKCHTPHELPSPQVGASTAKPMTIEACYVCHHTNNFTNCSQCHPIVPKVEKYEP